MTNGILDSGQKIVTNGLVLNYDVAQLRSYPTTGTVLTDLSGNNNTGTLVNGVGFNTGNGGSLVFDGVNDYVNLGNKFNPLLASQSFSLWFKINNNTTLAFILSKGNLNSATIGFSIFIESGVLNCRINASNTIGQRADNRFNVLNNSWYNLSMIIDRENNILQSYLNGVLSTVTVFGTSILNFNSITNVNDFYFGTSSVTLNYLNGNISQTQIYNRALSSTEVLQNFNANRSRYGL